MKRANIIRGLSGSLTRLTLAGMTGILIALVATVTLVLLACLYSIAVLGMGAAAMVDQLWSPVKGFGRLLQLFIRRNGNGHK